MLVCCRYDACPNLAQTGCWQRDACHRTRGLVERASKKREDCIEFATKMKTSFDEGNYLFAAAGDPRNLDTDGRPYWLLRIAGKPFKCGAKVRAWDAPNATIIPRNTWVVRAQWYIAL